MNMLLAKILRPTSSATQRDPEAPIRAPRIRKAGASRRRRMLAMLLLPPAVTVFSLLGTGIANATPVAGYGPWLSVGGGLVSQSQWNADITCNALDHTINVYAAASPFGNQSVSEQVYLYAYRNGAWTYTAGGVVNNKPLYFGGQRYPAGFYYVYVNFGWNTATGWQYDYAAITRYTQFALGLPREGNISAGCQL